MDDPAPQYQQSPIRILAGALAHLANHMASGCARSAYLATMLLEQIAADPGADSHLRRHARQLVEILEGEAAFSPVSENRPPRLRSLPGDRQTRVRKGVQ